MLNKNIDEIKKEIDDKYIDTITYEEFINKEYNFFTYNEKKYEFKSLILKTKNDNKEFLKFIYSIIEDGTEKISFYNDFDIEFQKKLLGEASFPKNQHIISQNILRKWLESKDSYYISQNSYNGKSTPKNALTVEHFLSQYNIFTRFIDNKIFTIETGFFKYVDDSFDILGKECDKIDKKNNYNNKIKNISKKNLIYERVINLYRFFSTYIYHTKGLEGLKNFGIDFLIRDLMNFSNIKKTREETFNFLVSEFFFKESLNNETFLEKFFNNNYSMSYIILANNQIDKSSNFNFAIGINWCTHSNITLDNSNFMDNNFYILLPLSPSVAIVIYNDEKKINKLVKEKKYLDYLLMQNLLQSVDSLQINKGIKILISGKNNYKVYNDYMNKVGNFNHLQEYIDFNVTDKSYIDLISNKIDTSILIKAQRIYRVIDDCSYKDTLKSIHEKTFFLNLVNKIVIIGSIQTRTFIFNESGILIGFKIQNIDTGEVLEI